MTLTIQDEVLEKELIESMLGLQSRRVAELSTMMMRSNKRAHVIKACLACANRCHPKHAKALIDLLTEKPSSAKDHGGIAAAIATIMYGTRAGFLHSPPTQSVRAVVDAMIAHQGGREVDNLGKLPARLGKKWACVVALAVAAVRSKVPQEPLVRNDRLEHLHSSTDSPESADGCSASTKMALLWTFSRSKAPDPPPIPKSEEDGWRNVVVDDVPTESESVRITRDEE
jgi:hypothetical protein